MTPSRYACSGFESLLNPKKVLARQGAVYLLYEALRILDGSGTWLDSGGSLLDSYLVSYVVEQSVTSDPPFG